jgi:hypothetical protein
MSHVHILTFNMYCKNAIMKLKPKISSHSFACIPQKLWVIDNLENNLGQILEGRRLTVHQVDWDVVEIASFDTLKNV